MGERDLSFDAAIRFASDLIRIPSPSGGEEAVARRVVDELQLLGFDDVWTDEVGNVLGRIRGAGKKPAVMLSSHLDVVDPGDAATWEHPPYGGVVADGFLHGRGAMDIKGPLALQTYAAARFAGTTPPGDIVVGHTVLEERGGWGMAHLLEGGEVRPGAVIIGESTGGDICVGHRGRAEVLVEVRGVAGHASAPERAANALEGVGPIVDAVRSFDATRLDSTDPVLGRASIVATDVIARPASRNVIPDSAVIVLDWRLLPGLDADAAAARLDAHLRGQASLPEGLSFSLRYSVEHQRTWTGVERAWRMFGPGFLVPETHPVVVAAASAVETATGRRPRIRPWHFATDGRHTCGERGVPTIGYAPGEERHAHTNAERLELAGARMVYDAYPAVIMAVLGAL
ncbi:MAG TPA: M20/M25/M40 family metallo-hydrolase [Longimicrobiales bacterium]|nr:M20/M25/M40 family metallo-hydrolase [Longimicrobiales bacterium]